MIGKYKGDIFILNKNINMKDYFNNKYYHLKGSKISIFSSAFALIDEKINILNPAIYNIKDFEKVLFSDDMNKKSFFDDFVYENEKFIYIHFYKIKYFKCKNFKTEFSEIKRAEKFLEDFLDLEFVNVQKENILLPFNELFLNAYEHGNLGMDFKDKEKLLKENKYINYLKKSKSDKLINVCIGKFIYKNTIYIVCKITDKGKGFDLKNHQKAFYNGRGLLISDKMCNGIFYNEKGNSVLFIKEMK